MDARKTIPDRAVTAPPVRRARRIVFGVVAIVLGLLPLALREGALRRLDAGGSDPAAGFDGAPLFERDGAAYRTARARAPFVATQEFAAGKPRNGFRVFCFGGSTVYGHPYLGDTAFPRWLELELAARDPARAWQAFNCGGISYASHRIAPLVREVLSYQPDLMIVATGHNEFLEDRTYAALKTRSALGSWIQARMDSLRLVRVARRAFRPERPTGVEPALTTRLDYESGYASYRRDAGWHERVRAQFEESVRDMVSACRAARVPILLVRLGSNLRDCPPFKSEHRAGLGAESEADWQAAFDLATAAEKTDLPRALQLYREAAQIDGEHALLNYRIARALERLGRTSEAHAYFLRARDEDICPLRITSPFEQALVRIAADTGTPLVDAAGLLSARSGDGMAGFDWYLDHVHPTIAGHQVIARALAEEMRSRGLLPRAAPWPEEERREAYATHLAGLGAPYFADGQRRLGWLDTVGAAAAPRRRGRATRRCGLRAAGVPAAGAGQRCRGRGGVARGVAPRHRRGRRDGAAARRGVGRGRDGRPGGRAAAPARVNTHRPEIPFRKGWLARPAGLCSGDLPSYSPAALLRTRARTRDH